MNLNDTLPCATDASRCEAVLLRWSAGAWKEVHRVGDAVIWPSAWWPLLAAHGSARDKIELRVTAGRTETYAVLPEGSRLMDDRVVVGNGPLSFVTSSQIPKGVRNQLLRTSPVTRLRDVLPSPFLGGDFDATEAFRYRDEPVRCSGGDLEKPWPGREKDVGTWWLLENGKAIGVRKNRRGLSFPLVKYAE